VSAKFIGCPLNWKLTLRIKWVNSTPNQLRYIFISLPIHILSLKVHFLEILRSGGPLGDLHICEKFEMQSNLWANILVPNLNKIHLPFWLKPEHQQERSFISKRMSECVMCTVPAKSGPQNNENSINIYLFMIFPHIVILNR